MSASTARGKPADQDLLLCGLQLFPYELVDEGADRVVEVAIEAYGANVLLPAVSYVPEQHPQPSGRLPHNPRRETYRTDGGSYMRLDPKHFPAGLVPPPSEESIDWEKGLSDLRRVANERGISLVPWLPILNGRVATSGNPDLVVNASDEPVPGWLCAARPRVRAYAVALLEEVIELWNPRAVFIDRFRYPEWGPNGIVDALGCRCTICREGPGGIVGRTQAVTGLVEELAKVCAIRGVSLWLDVWPPSYARVLGQDLVQLSRYASWCKPFAYHRLGGGADLARMIRSISNDARELQRIWRALIAYFDFEEPTEFSVFEQEGFPPTWATQEFRRASQQLDPRCSLAAGIQLWQVGHDGAREAVAAALAAQPRGVIGYCYSWASKEELEAAGATLMPLLSQAPFSSW